MASCSRGTPIQNDLDELWSVMDFACPGLMGDLASFRQIYSIPIERARERGAKEEAIQSATLRRRTGWTFDRSVHSLEKSGRDQCAIVTNKDGVRRLRASDVESRGAVPGSIETKVDAKHVGENRRVGSIADSPLSAPFRHCKNCVTPQLWRRKRMKTTSWRRRVN